MAGESVTVGTRKDLDKIAELVGNSGLIRVKSIVTVGGSDLNFNGIVTANLFDDSGIKCVEFHTVTYASDSITGGSPIIVGGQLYMDGTACKCHITAVPVSGASRSKSAKE